SYHIKFSVAGSSQQAMDSNGASTNAFHDVDERRRMAIRRIFETGVCMAAIAKQFDTPEREVWSAARNDRLTGWRWTRDFWRHEMLASYRLVVQEIILPDRNWGYFAISTKFAR